MKKIIKYLIVFMIFYPFMAQAGQKNIPEKSGEGETTSSDFILERRIKNVLAAQVPNGNFTVNSYRGRILLTGQVPVARDKIKAEQAVKNVAGIKKVWNYLSVGSKEDIANTAKDGIITSGAKAKLFMQKGVSANNVKVITSNGVVYLLGENVGNLCQIEYAIKDISKIDGVQNIINLIQ